MSVRLVTGHAGPTFCPFAPSVEHSRDRWLTVPIAHPWAHTSSLLNWELWTQHHGKPSREEQARGKPTGWPLPPPLSTSLWFFSLSTDKEGFVCAVSWPLCRLGIKTWNFFKTSVIQRTNRVRECERKACWEGRQAAGLEILRGVRWQKQRDLVPPGISSILVHPLFLRLLCRSLCCCMCWSAFFQFALKGKNKAVWRVDSISIIRYLCSLSGNSMLLNKNTVHRKLKKVICYFNQVENRTQNYN